MWEKFYNKEYFNSNCHNGLSSSLQSYHTCFHSQLNIFFSFNQIKMIKVKMLSLYFLFTFPAPDSFCGYMDMAVKINIHLPDLFCGCCKLWSWILNSDRVYWYSLWWWFCNQQGYFFTYFVERFDWDHLEIILGIPEKNQIFQNSLPPTTKLLLSSILTFVVFLSDQITFCGRGFEGVSFIFTNLFHFTLKKGGLLEFRKKKKTGNYFCSHFP